MNLEDGVKDIIQNKLSDGTIEKIVSEMFEKSIYEATRNLFKSYGSINKLIEDKISAILVPQIETHDFSNHIVKLDTILTEIINNTVLTDNKKILENFKELMLEDEKKKVVKVSEIFEKWCEHVGKEVNTDGLEVNFDDSLSYEYVEVSMVVEHDEGHEWSDFKKANIIFECEHDEKMNFLIPISKWEKYGDGVWSIRIELNTDISNLRYMDDFELYLFKLKRSGCRIELDTEEIEESVVPEKEPEISYS